MTLKDQLGIHGDTDEWTPETLATAITMLLTEAKREGVYVAIDNECCGCSKMKLVACSGDYDTPTYVEKEVTIS